MNGKRSKDGSRTALAKELGVSDRAISAGIRRGKVPPDLIAEDGAVTDVQAAADYWRKNTHPADRRNTRTLSRNSSPEEVREVAEELGVADDEMSYNEASRLLKICQMRLAEIDLAEKQGRLIDVDDVRKEASYLARTTRDAMLAIPDRLAAELAGIADPHKVHAKLTAEIRAAIMMMIEKVENERKES